MFFFQYYWGIHGFKCSKLLVDQVGKEGSVRRGVQVKTLVEKIKSLLMEIPTRALPVQKCYCPLVSGCVNLKIGCP